MAVAPEPELAALTETVLAEWLGDGRLTRFYFICDFIDAEGDQRWAYAVASGQSMADTSALIEWARGVAQHEQRRYLESCEDEDDETGD